jgi:hypothetical protein
MDVSAVINQFVTFINNSYDEIAQLFQCIENDKKNIILADKIENGFYQFMWEIIVEAQLCPEENYLEPYGDGADFYGKSSRVVYPGKFANDKINVNVKNRLDYFSQKISTIENLDLVKFVNFENNQYFVKRPFDFVLCEDYSGTRFLFRLNEVTFSLVKIDESQ